MDGFACLPYGQGLRASPLRFAALRCATCRLWAVLQGFGVVWGFAPRLWAVLPVAFSVREVKPQVGFAERCRMACFGLQNHPQTSLLRKRDLWVNGTDVLALVPNVFEKDAGLRFLAP